MSAATACLIRVCERVAAPGSAAVYSVPEELLSAPVVQDLVDARQSETQRRWSDTTTGF